MEFLKWLWYFIIAGIGLSIVVLVGSFLAAAFFAAFWIVAAIFAIFVVAAIIRSSWESRSKGER